MRWLGNLLLGTFTRHPTTKLLALLLSLGLFGFVQASLNATQVIRQLTLRFNLALTKADYVLLNEEVPFSDLSISGMRSKVDPLARLYRGEPEVNLAIDDKFLKVYGEEDPVARTIRIRITQDLFADDRLFGRDITVGEFAERVVVLDPIDTKTAKVEVDLTQTPPTVTDPKHEYEGSKIDLKLNVKSIRIEGPASAFTGDAALFVSVPNLMRQLARFQTTGERGEAKLSPVEIRWQGIAPELLSRLRISADELGGDEMSVSELKRRIVATCPVTKRKQPMSLKDVPIDIRHPQPRKFDLIEDYEVFGAVIFTDGELREGRMRQLEVKLPGSLAGNREFLGNLIAVLDVGAAQVDAEDPDTMYVPFYLDVRDRSRKDDLATLALVEVVTETPPEFRKRTGK